MRRGGHLGRMHPSPLQLQLARSEVEIHRGSTQAISDREEKWSTELAKSTCELHMCQDRVRVLEEGLKECQEELDSVRGELRGTQRILQMTNSEVRYEGWERSKAPSLWGLISR